VTVGGLVSSAPSTLKEEFILLFILFPREASQL
jgi:hypothetical protein